MDNSYRPPTTSPLDISEVFRLVVDHVAHDRLDDRQKSNQLPFIGATNLRNLALTCKSFREEALDRLWEYQSSLARLGLVLCLPPDVINWSATHLSRYLTPHDLDRLVYYASKIKVLGATELSRSWSRSIWQLPPTILPVVLGQYRSKSPLFPKIEALHWKVHDFTELSLCEGTLFGRHLKSVLLKAWVNQDSPSVCLSQLPWKWTICVICPYLPSLKEFGIHLDCDEPRALPATMPDEMRQMVQGLEEIERLSIGDVYTSWALLMDIAKFQNLSHLDVSIDPECSPACPASSPLSFPRLQSLYLSVHDPRASVNFLNIAQLPTLSSIAITIIPTFFESYFTWSVNPIFQALAAQPCRDKLSLICIARHVEDTEDASDIEPIDGGSFGCLLSFKNLRHIQIHLHAPIQLDAYMLRRMAEAWPMLTTLSLPQRMSNSVPKLRLADLLPLGAWCPSLSYLSLRFDATGDIPDYAHMKPLRSLENFNVCTSPVANENAVADLFKTMFPKVALRWGWKYWIGNGYWPDPIDGGEELDQVDVEYKKCWNRVNEIRLGLPVD